MTNANTTATNRTPPCLKTARCVLTFNNSNPPITAVMQPAKVRALIALADARFDRHAFMLGDSPCFDQYGSLIESAKALERAAETLSYTAQSFRRARWDGAPAPRLDSRFIPNARASMRVISVLDDLIYALIYAERVRGADIGEVYEQALGLSNLTYRYPSIAPSKEEELAAQGFTAGELLVSIACRLVERTATVYARFGTAPDVTRMAQEALETARDAYEVIEAGVDYTLAGAPAQGH